MQAADEIFVDWLTQELEASMTGRDLLRYDAAAEEMDAQLRTTAIAEEGVDLTQHESAEAMDSVAGPSGSAGPAADPVLGPAEPEGEAAAEPAHSSGSSDFIQRTCDRLSLKDISTSTVFRFLLDNGASKAGFDIHSFAGADGGNSS